MVTFANLQLRPSTKFEVRRPSLSEDTAHLLCQLSIYNSFPVIRTTCKKSSFLRTPAFIFLFALGRPCGNHAKRCMNEKTIQCLPNPSQHVPIYIQQFTSYSNRKCKKTAFSRTAAHIFVSPGDAPATSCMNGKSIQCLPNSLRHVPIYRQQFPSYTMLTSMLKSKNRNFYHIFVFPGDAPGAITLSVVWMEREFDAYKLSRCMCPSNYYRF